MSPNWRWHKYFRITFTSHSLSGKGANMLQKAAKISSSRKKPKIKCSARIPLPSFSANTQNIQGKERPKDGNKGATKLKNTKLKNLSHQYNKSQLPLAFTTLFNCPPKIALSSDGTKLWVLVTADLFFGPTVSHSSSSDEETSCNFLPAAPNNCPSSLSSSSCIWSMTKLRNSCASSCLCKNRASLHHQWLINKGQTSKETGTARGDKKRGSQMSFPTIMPHKKAILY